MVDFSPILRSLGLKPEELMKQYQEVQQGIADAIVHFDGLLRHNAARIEALETWHKQDDRFDRLFAALAVIIESVEKQQGDVAALHQAVTALSDEFGYWRLNYDPTMAPTHGDHMAELHADIGALAANGTLDLAGKILPAGASFAPLTERVRALEAPHGEVQA